MLGIRRNHATLLTALGGLLAAPAAAQAVVLSDSFDRTTGLNETLAEGGFSDWGAFDNALGGDTAPSPYLLADDPGPAAQEVTDGASGIINFGRVILDVNLARPDIIAAGGVSVRIDVNPGNTGGPAFNGRDWLGLFLGDSNQLSGSIGSQFALTGGNPDARVGIGPRNSGTALTRLGPALRRAGGLPGALTEPIFDQQAWDDYVAWFSGGDGSDPGDPVEDFPSDTWYTVELRVTPDAGVGLFDADAPHRAQVFIGEQGGPLSRVDFDPSTPGVFEELFDWGDNNPLTASGGADLTPGQKDAYLVLVGNGPDHRFDNLVITAVPEPASLTLAALAGLPLLRRPRGSAEPGARRSHQGRTP